MKQVIVKKGKIITEEIPVPQVESGKVLVKVHYSCISQGTEISSLKASGKSALGKIIETIHSKPEKVRKGIISLKKEGISRTLEKIQGQGDIISPIGYSASGVVIEVGEGIEDIKIGDRVACAGAGYANHAEYISIPRNLVVKIPEDLDFKKASTVTLGSIAMQGVRRGDFKLGEFVTVIGLGFLGQITLQMLNANGCRVIGIDIDDRRCNIAKKHGTEVVFNSSCIDIVKEVARYTNGYGVDGVIFSASTADYKPLSQAFQMCKKKGRVILVGVSGMQIDRNDIYPKELDFLISTSYGPGRYDELYEEKGLDYPYAYIRWTENRNMEEYLRLLSRGKIIIDDLIEKIYPISDATKAYEELQNLQKKPVIALFEYPHKEESLERKLELTPFIKRDKEIINVAIIGAGGFAKNVHLPNLLKLKNKYNIYAICSRNGVNAKETGKKFGANKVTTDYDEILKDDNVDLVMICIRHNLHTDFSIRALKSGKSVFVEKPMAMNKKELNELVKVIEESKQPFMVGFNRRFSPFAKEIKKYVKNRINPMMISYRMNAGYIPLNHWVHTEEGGGRNIGEACHIYDLFNFFTDSEIVLVEAKSITQKSEQYASNDNFITTIKYKDGSLCTLTYTALGSKDYPKEEMEIYVDGKILKMLDYRELKIFGTKTKGLKTRIQEKGHLDELKVFYKAFKGGKESIPFWQLIQATEISFEVEKKLWA